MRELSARSKTSDRASGRDLHRVRARARGRRGLRDASLGGDRLADLVVTFRNCHNYSARDARRAREQGRRSTRSSPAAFYGVLDHTRRHMEPNSRENGRRVDPVQMIKEIQAAGFRVRGLLHPRSTSARPTRSRSEVGRQSVTGNSDRFALLFMRPEE